MSLKSKLLLTAILPLALMAVSCLVVFLQFGNVKSDIEALVSRDLKLLDRITKFESVVNELRYRIVRYSMGLEKEEKIKNLLDELYSITSEISKMSDIDLEGSGLNDLKEKILSILGKGMGEDELRKEIELVDSMVEDFTGEITKVEKTVKERANESKSKLDSSTHLMTLLSVWLPSIVIVVSIIGIVFVIRQMFSKLGKLMDVARRMEEDDISVEIEEESGSGEIIRLINTFKRSIDHLRESMFNLRNNTEEIASEMDSISDSMEEIAANMTSIAQNVDSIAHKTEDISASIEQTTAGTEELSAASKAIADNAQNAREQADFMSEKAKEGGEVIENVIDQMKQITEVSDEIQRVVESFNKGAQDITEFVETISAIADQTNLLALNAAIEAARAGEAGKGFAVVADEIRKLAEESRRAAERIKNVVEEISATAQNAVTVSERISSMVEEGSKLADDASYKLREIIDGIEKIVGMLKEISSSVEEQAGSIDEISQAMTMNANTIMDISASLQEINASIENVTASSEEVTASVKTVKEKLENLR